MKVNRSNLLKLFKPPAATATSTLAPSTKRRLRIVWKKLRPVRARYILAALILALFCSVYGLRQNYAVMVDLREQLYAADKNNSGTEQALNRLRAHVYAHMNTNLSAGNNTVYPPLQLKYTYERLVSAENDRVKNINATVYTEAQAHCEQQIPDSFSGRPRVPCIRDYVAAHGVKAQPIPDGLYKFDFESPSWSSDLAGWSLLISALLAAAFVARLSFNWYVKRHRVV